MLTPMVKRPVKPGALRAAGVLAMFSAILTLPMFVLSMQLEGRHDEIARTMQIIMQGAGTAIFMAVTISLRCFLGRNCAFGRANAIILCLVLLNLVYGAASCAGILITGVEERLQAIVPALVILLGIAQAGLGMRLFALDNDLGGMKRPYCWLNIVTGICLASLLLIPVGVIVSAIADVMLATIFLREARRPALSRDADIP